MSHNWHGADYRGTKIVGSTIGATVTANTSGVGVDLDLTNGLVTALAALGTIAVGTTGVITFEESADNATGWTVVAGSQSIAVAVANANTAIFSFPMRRTKRYVRAVLTIAGGSPSIFCTIAIMADKQQY